MMLMKKKEYFTPECLIIEMNLEGSILIGSDLIGGGGDGEMDEGGEV